MRKMGVMAMLESDARKRRCHHKMMHNIPEGDRVGDIFCDGLDCMGWEEKTIPRDIGSRCTRWIKCDPPEGWCGVK